MADSEQRTEAEAVVEPPLHVQESALPPPLFMLEPKQGNYDADHSEANLTDSFQSRHRSKKDSKRSAKVRRQILEYDQSKEVDLDLSDTTSQQRRKSNSATTAAANKFKVFILLTLCTMGILVTTATYLMLSNQSSPDAVSTSRIQVNNWELEFALVATNIQDTVTTRTSLLQQALQAESQTLADVALASQVDWPFFASEPVIHGFEQRAQHMRQEHGGLHVLGLAPFVRRDQENLWNRFVQFKTNGTVRQPIYSFLPSANDTDDATRDNVASTSSNNTTGHDVHVHVHSPVWLLSPPPRDMGIINFDILSSSFHNNNNNNNNNSNTSISNSTTSLTLDQQIRQFWWNSNQQSNHRLFISSVLDMTHISSSSKSTASDKDEQDGSYDPHSLLMQPVYGTHSSNGSVEQQQHAEPVAILFGIFYWRDLLLHLFNRESDVDDRYIFPSSRAVTVKESMVVICEVQNTCGQFLQFEVLIQSGGRTSTVNLVHQGSTTMNYDASPTKDNLLFQTPLFKNNPYTEDDQNDDDINPTCQHTVYVYPSPEMYTAATLVHLSNTTTTTNNKKKTTLYTTLMALLFVVGGVVIWMCIQAIQKRQKKLLTTAFQTNNLIASLFPASFAPIFQTNLFGPTTATTDADSKTSVKGSAIVKDKPTKGKKHKKTKKKTDGTDDLDVSEADNSFKRKYRLATTKDNEAMSGSFSTNQNRRRRSSGASAASRGTLAANSSKHGNAKKIKAKQQAKLIESTFGSRPIADLFPEATVMYADIVGFTAWSSSREPYHIFELLESIYLSLDQVARRKHVFKVETVGDCYVAVTGIPVPNKDHAVIMAGFARECLAAMDRVTKTLEVALGPDTADLSMRIGISSGPVTAGVLRGDRPRFQLFGETVNRASRIEEDGEPGRILISKETAGLLAAAGKSSWVIHRENKVTRAARGKVELATFWLDPRLSETDDVDDGSKDMLHPKLLRASKLINQMDQTRLISAKHQRLIDWIVDQMQSMLKQIVVQRNHMEGGIKSYDPEDRVVIPQAAVAQSEVCVFEEVKEVISMPTFDAAAAQKLKNAEEVELTADVTWQLHDYVTSISTMYRDNPFHNFEHASHVTMSVIKLLSRVVCPTEYNSAAFDEEMATPRSSKKDEHELHDFSYGISSDPLSQFAVVFGALIHDVDHLGVSNAQLVKEGDRLARIYKSQSVAEQNSVNIAWDLLMDPTFEALRCCIYTNEEEFDRFRATVVNVVMATDIVDKDLKALRNARWEKAFAKTGTEETTKEDSDRMATLVLEHLIQASDISHTMQHWHIYQKWNHRLFKELYIAHKKGRMDANPADFWFNGEIGFFDFYIIPLAKKLRDCGVFGVSCDEFLNYALENRSQWEKEGEEVVKELIQQVENDKELQRLIKRSQKNRNCSLDKKKSGEDDDDGNAAVKLSKIDSDDNMDDGTATGAETDCAAVDGASKTADEKQ